MHYQMENVMSYELFWLLVL